MDHVNRKSTIRPLLCEQTTSRMERKKEGKEGRKKEREREQERKKKMKENE